MRNKIITERNARDIDKQVAKVIKDLGNPAPPIRLEDVRLLLNLDKKFYSSTETSFLQEIVHDLRLAGKQIIDRPQLLIEAAKAWDLRALFLPDRNRILIDSSVPELKQRWIEAHEINHSINPLHNKLMHGDNRLTLSPTCHEQIEAEANYGAARLLFLQDKFSEAANSLPLEMSTVQYLRKRFGNTLTTTLWHLIDQSTDVVFGIVSCHPRHLPEDHDPSKPCSYFISSKKFSEMFSNITENELYEMIKSYCRYNKGGPLGNAEFVLADSNEGEHVFSFETFSNTYDALTIGVYLKPRNLSVAIQYLGSE